MAVTQRQGVVLRTSQHVLTAPKHLPLNMSWEGQPLGISGSLRQDARHSPPLALAL